MVSYLDQFLSYICFKYCVDGIFLKTIVKYIFIILNFLNNFSCTVIETYIFWLVKLILATPSFDFVADHNIIEKIIFLKY